MDVKSAFLNVEIDCDVYVAHPYNLPSHMKQSKYYKLNKALYGLKQAPLRWFLRLREALIQTLGYNQLFSDGTVFLKKHFENGEVIVIVLCYGDDMIFLSNNSEVLKSATSDFLKELTGSRDPLPWYVSICIERGDDHIRLSQTAYIDQKLKEYNLEDLNPQETPMQKNFYDEARAQKDDPVSGLQEYREMIGSLQYLNIRTHPDISTVVGILSQYSSGPNAFLLKCVKRVYADLRATQHFRLVYNHSASDAVDLELMADSDYAGDKEDRKSRSGWIGFLYVCAVIWPSRKQMSTSLSTAEAEYIAMNHCAMDIAWFRMLLAELGEDMSAPILLRGDNTAAS